MLKMLQLTVTVWIDANGMTDADIEPIAQAVSDARDDIETYGGARLRFLIERANPNIKPEISID